MSEQSGTMDINGETWVKRAAAGPRVVLVLDRGWVFAGDVVEAAPGRIALSRVVQVRSWRGCGWSGVLENPMRDSVTLESVPTGLDAPEGAELFRHPVHADWGIK